MTTKFQDFLVSTFGGLIWLGLSWAWARAVRKGRSMTSTQSKMLWYSFGFILGLAYIMMLGSWFAWPSSLWFILIILWGAILALIAWWRHHRHGTAAQQDRSSSKQ